MVAVAARLQTALVLMMQGADRRFIQKVSKVSLLVASNGVNTGEGVTKRDKDVWHLDRFVIRSFLTEMRCFCVALLPERVDCPPAATVSQTLRAG